MMLNELLNEARARSCSDVHLAANRNPVFRKNGNLVPYERTLEDYEISGMFEELLDEEKKKKLDERVDVDFCYTIDEIYRHRVNIFYSGGCLAAAIRIINDSIPSFEDLKFPDIIRKLSLEQRGLVLVTGPTGSGKSTTLAAMIEYINKNYSMHIITIEDPVEYVYTEKKSIINQREVGSDVKDFSSALRSSLREDPDIVLVGEMRDYETISAAITAAETGHLVLSTLHTVGAANTIDRIIDVFPAHSQQQIRIQLAQCLKGVITQQLIEKNDKSGRVAAFEIMIGTDAALNLIRENKCHQMDSILQTGSSYGMVSMDNYLKTLVINGSISRESAIEKSFRKNEFRV